MFGKIGMAIVFGCAVCASLHAAPRVLTVTPIFGQLLVLPMPQGFVDANEQASSSSYIRESVLKGENVDDWSQMITVTGEKGLASNPEATPEGLANALGSGFYRTCPDSYKGQAIESAKVDGNDGFVAFLSCGVAGARDGESYSESAIILVIKGSQDYYTVQWAERGVASSAPMTFDKAKWLGRLNRLAPIMLCERKAGEQAPFPDCADRKAPVEHF